MSPKLLNFLLILIPFAVYFGYIDPMYYGTTGIFWTPDQGILQLKSENVQYGTAINQVSLIESEIEKVDKSYKSIEPETKEKVVTMLPDTIDTVKLRNEIITIGSRVGVAVTNLDVQDDKKNTSPIFGVYLVSFSVKSRYPVFKKFMEGVEKNMRFFNLDSITIQRQEKSDLDGPEVVITDTEALNIKVTFKVYYIR